MKEQLLNYTYGIVQLNQYLSGHISPAM